MKVNGIASIVKVLTFNVPDKFTSPYTISSMKAAPCQLPYVVGKVALYDFQVMKLSANLISDVCGGLDQ